MIFFQPEQRTVFPLTMHYDPIPYFSLFQVYESYCCSCKQVAHTYVKPTMPILEISQAKIVDTRVGASLEGQNLTGNKLLLSGAMHTKLVLTQPCNGAARDFVIDRTLPFATFIVIPYMEKFPEHIYIGYQIEDFSSRLTQDNSIYTVFTLLLTYNGIEM